MATAARCFKFLKGALDVRTKNVVSENLTLFPNLAKQDGYWAESQFSGASQK